MVATREQNRAFRTMLTKLGLQDMKDELCMQASNGRTTHGTELTVSEMRGLIEHLVEKSDIESKVISKRSEVMRKRIYSMCYSIGWTKWDDKIHRDIVDSERLDAWLIKYSYKHKLLKYYDYLELPRLVTQFENLLKSTL